MPVNWCVLLAAASPFESVGRYLHRAGSLRENLVFVLFGTVIASVWIALFLWERYRKNLPESQTSSIPLFQELCRTHALSSHEIALLNEVAQFHQLAEPALLFVQPERFRSLSQAQPLDAARIDQLVVRLFGSLD